MKVSSLIFLSFFAGFCLVQQADASLITPISMELSEIISGGTPENSPPWLQVDFEDAGTPGTVTLTIRARNLSADEFLSELFLNLDPTMDVTKLQFGSPVIGGSFTAPTILQGGNSLKADGDGYYDLLFQFATSEGERFGITNTYQITVTSTDPIIPNSFNFTSAADNDGTGVTPYYSAAHLQSLASGEDSVWVGAVPEPSTIVLALLGVAGLGLVYRRGRR